MDESVYGVWLQCAMGEGSRKVPALLEYFGSCRAVFESDNVERHLCGILFQQEIQKMQDTPLDAAKEILEACDRLHYDVLTPDSPKFPLRLRNIPDYPAALYISGTLPDIDDEVCIGMVGTRRASRYGYEIATALARELSACGAIVISGGARGIDTASHQGALIGGSPTLAVLGCGINTRYNLENERLRTVISSCGALISEYPPGAPALSYHFPIRNRLISALSLGVIVVEAGEKSGSLITANLALEQGKDIFAVPGEIKNTQAIGANRLIRDGAKPIENAFDVLEEYVVKFPHKLRTENLRNRLSRVYDKGVRPKWERSPSSPSSRTSGGEAENRIPVSFPAVAENPPAAKQEHSPPARPVGLTDRAAKVLDTLTDTPQSAEDIAVQTGLTAAEVTTCITELELFRLVQRLPGNRYIG